MKNQITQKKLKELLHYDSETGIFTWIITNTNYVKAGDVAGTESHGYIVIAIEGETYKAHRLAWLYVHGYFPENLLDHKDRIRHHNWINNLREASNQCNQRNTGNRVDNKSGVKGVSWFKATEKWQVHIAVNGKLIFLGRHTCLLEAACHRLAAEQCLNWEGCDSSSPAYQYVKDQLGFNRDRIYKKEWN